ncbi:MAG: hypothetical protein JWM78_2695 [Verrucomicrobiaceae bacterium]|nr:hypothetical protein [Verrucomicrobiaceae bacterium]
MDDYYIKDRELAAYFEAQWFDKLSWHDKSALSDFAAAPVAENFIQLPFFQQSAELITSSLRAHAVAAENLLEIGPSLGRTCYELITANNSLKKITVIEPSQILLKHFKNIITSGGQHEFPAITNFRQLGQVTFDANPVTRACSNIDFSFIESPIDAPLSLEAFDVTVCLNVLDQCGSPLAIVETLQRNTRCGGLVALSCTYQWDKKHVKDFMQTRSDISDYFSPRWEKVADANFEYRFRTNERYASTFLSHLVIFKKHDA